MMMMEREETRHKEEERQRDEISMICNEVRLSGELNSKVKTPAKENNFPSLSFNYHNSYSRWNIGLHILLYL